MKTKGLLSPGQSETDRLQEGQGSQYHCMTEKGKLRRSHLEDEVPRYALAEGESPGESHLLSVA
ncbi:hypothetical protein Clacol_005834 [Clathrus columnatus]|uniref:Uncharacterized protein n=1 Tax=Clathrus columnatus TaxID=1419009 RepID=A0AAV5AEI5_9AGAM|nr:hypothetical protein Clacol_005834 [Clathrus columnatus]